MEGTVGELIYSAITSVDGYVEDADGRFDWGRPSDDVAAFVNVLERSTRTQVYGRRMYEVMTYWEADPVDDEWNAVDRAFADYWRSTEKIVFSRTLADVASANTRIEREFTVDVIERLKSSAATDVSLAGATLAGHALELGVVDEVRLFVCPVVVGAGKHALPTTTHRPMTLLDERRFDSGFVYLRYRLS